MKFGKNIIIWLVAFIVLSVIMSMMEESRFSKEFQGLAFSEFMNEVENNRVASVSISGSEIVGETKDGRKFATYAPQSPSMVDTLLAKNVKVDARPEANSENSFMAVLLSWLPMIVLIGIWIFFLRQASSGNNKAMSFGKSRARLIKIQKK